MLQLCSACRVTFMSRTSKSGPPCVVSIFNQDSRFKLCVKRCGACRGNTFKGHHGPISENACSSAAKKIALARMTGDDETIHIHTGAH